MAVNLSPETELTGATSPTSVSPEEIAARLPQYEILEFLGRGGMGVVYKAGQTALDREVAIKVLAGEWQDDADFAARFEREAKTLAQMSHPNIVTIHDFGDAEGLYYIVMEFVDGVNLRDLLSDGKMEPEQALAIVPSICEALEYAHSKGVVHRDIKPENLLLDRDGRVKIADFGIASLAGTTKEVSGTPSYMAPEQANGSVDRRTDIYALGIVLYEMLTGERPEKDVVPPSSKVEVDVRIDEIVLRALEKKPERRYQTAREFCTTAELVMATPHDVTKEAGTSSSSQTSHEEWTSPTSGWGWVIGNLFDITFTSRTAYQLANSSALGFLGFLGFLGNIPQLVAAKSLFGLFGLFGLIGIACTVELYHRARAIAPADFTDADGKGSDAAQVPNYSPWEITTALAGTIFSAAMLFLAMGVADPWRAVAMFGFIVAFSIGTVSLAGYWPFPSPIFPEPNFSSRNLTRSQSHGDRQASGEDALFAGIAAVVLLLLSATGDAVVMLVGASIMLVVGLACYSRGTFRLALLVGLAAIVVAGVAVLVTREFL